MNDIWKIIITAGITAAVGGTISFLLTKLFAFPKKWKQNFENELKAAEENRLQKERVDERLIHLEDATEKNRKQNFELQQKIQDLDVEILKTCETIRRGVEETKQTVESRLNRLEKREKNALRAKILEEYRLFTDEHKNPLLAWTEMECHAFFKLVSDYESLGGNDYVHSIVVPAMNELGVIEMSNLADLKKLYDSRRS